MTQTHINIAMLAHVDAGKTTLSEALLYKSGSIRKAGRVDNKDAFLDTNEMERNRGITIFSKQAVFSYGGCEFTLLDTPGHVDFSAARASPVKWRQAKSAWHDGRQTSIYHCVSR